MDVRPALQSDSFSQDALQEEWRCLNRRYFAGLLPPIAIQWSTRLTSSVGLFVSRGGPRTPSGLSAVNRREIRLSLPLLERLAQRTPFVEQEVRNTLAHEMIHQWQFDILRRRPNHGPDFLRKMAEMNRSGEVAVTTYHTLRREVLALSRFAWRCQTCGLVYRRQRNTINPRWHQCGRCHGALLECGADNHSPLLSYNSVKKLLFHRAGGQDGQLTLAFPTDGS
jgi:predicted SprT family Zn-dependent metalloprotease